jgi:hypothetical protein
MTNTVTISCILDTTDPTAPLGFEVYIDSQKMFDVDHVQAPQQISLQINDESAEHRLKFVMKNKTAEHTSIDHAGNILSDARLILSELKFDDMPIDHTIDQLVYEHNANGTGPLVQDKFYGEMGCNGTVSLGFTTPIYLWLLENM